MTALVVGSLTISGLAACGNDDDPTAEPGDGASSTADETSPSLQAACDQLADLGHAMLDVREAQTREEVRSGVEPELQEFRASAVEANDDRLIELAQEAEAQFEVYLTSEDPIDAREAGNDADIALDRAVQQCVEQGATTAFPEEPGLKSADE